MTAPETEATPSATSLRHPTHAQLAAVYALEGVPGFGPQKFKSLYQAGVSPEEVLADPSRFTLRGKRPDELRVAIAGIPKEKRQETEGRASGQLERAHKAQMHIVLYGDPAYPRNVFESNNPVPVIYARGDLSILNECRAVACVGSREIAPPYDGLHARFAKVAVIEGLTVVSGFAMGADSLGHKAAKDARGRTICVLPNGLDRPFPPENAPLWDELLNYPGALMVSEFPLGRGADSLTLRKRNKLIVAFSLAVLVSQSSASGGAMNAFRFGVEQRKPIATFTPDGTDRTSGNVVIQSDPKAKTAVMADDEAQWRVWLAGLSS